MRLDLAKTHWLRVEFYRAIIIWCQNSGMLQKSIILAFLLQMRYLHMVGCNVGACCLRALAVFIRPICSLEVWFDDGRACKIYKDCSNELCNPCSPE